MGASDQRRTQLVREPFPGEHPPYPGRKRYGMNTRKLHSRRTKLRARRPNPPADPALRPSTAIPGVSSHDVVTR
jgi:hypothetical protein